MPRDIKMSHCDRDECEVKRGHKASVEVEMQADRSIRRIFGTVHVFINNQWVNVNLGGRENVCEHLSHGKCPMSAGDRITYRGELNVPKYARLGMKTFVRIRAVDQDSHVVACFKIKAKVVD